MRCQLNEKKIISIKSNNQRQEFWDLSLPGFGVRVIMGAFLGHAYQWRRFEKGLKTLQQKHDFKIIHAKELKKKKGEFSGWSGEECMALITDITLLSQKTLTEGIAVAIPYERYIKEYKETPFPKGMKPDSHYGLCFRACLGAIMDIVSASGKNPKLHVVLEAGHKNSGDAERIFYDCKKILEEAGINILETFTTAPKKEAMPLMTADFLAHTFAMMRADGDEWKRGKPIERPLPKKQRSGLIYIDPTPDGLTSLKNKFENLKEARQKIWRDKKRT